MIVALLILVSVLYKHPPRSIIQHDFTGRAMEPTVSGQYLSSLIARDNGDMAKATEFIRQALKKDPLSPQLLEQTYSLALINGEVADAIKLAQQIPPSKSQTELAAILLMLDDVKKNDFVMARKRLATVPEEGINMLVIPSLKVWLDYGITEGKTPMHAEDAIKRAANFAPFIQYQLALMNDLGGYGADAETYYEKAAKETARMPFRIAESLANFYSRTGK